MYTQIQENHPGVYNDEDPTFHEVLKNAFTSAQKESSPKSAIEAFAKSFNDIHLWVSWNKKQQSQNHSPLDFSMQNISSKITWITLPTFDLARDQEKSFYQINEKISKLKNKTVVFDLRGNQGGNSNYGSEIIDSLFGKKYTDVKRKIAYQNIFVDWRASVDNLSHMTKLYDQYQTDWIKKVAEGMKDSIAEDLPYYRQYYKSEPVVDTYPLSKTKVFIIIDQNNMSAALDFIDELKMMTPNVILVGRETKGDRLYMEVRKVNLPSGLGTFSFPIKVYRNRLRGDQVTYKPDFEAQTNDTEKLKRLIIQIR